jgi:cell division cycle 20-like protein 1 (cofactor of APC complex)
MSFLLKVLDAPDLQDDFYLNLVDWSSGNVLSVGLGTCVYFFVQAQIRLEGCVIYLEMVPL